jgi:D-arabinose 1-dehydrogenase-like Zn-dependent alcohol dehydrogenase
MRAVVYSGYGTRPELTQVADPACPPDGVVIAVGASGVCRSDWHAWKGHDPVALPHIGGHELAGVVAQAGPEVTRWRAGDRVTAPFVCGCGRCEYCLAGDAQVCPRQTQPGFTGPGSFAELVAVHAADANLIPLPDVVGFVAAACLGCRFATAFRAVTAHGRVRAGDWLAVHGCGGVGLSAVMIGAALGARVVATDVAASALNRARELGAEFAVDAGACDPAAVIGEITGGGAHVSVDALGSPATAACSVRCLRRRGRHVQVGLLLDGPTPVPMDLVVARELELYGSHGMAARDYPPMMAMVADGTLRPGLLVGRVIGLEEAGRALAAMDGPAEGAGMTVIRLPGSSLQVGGEPVGHLRPVLEGVAGQAVAAVGVQHQLGTGRLAGQAFGLIGRDQAVPAARRDQQRAVDPGRGVLQGQRRQLLARLGLGGCARAVLERGPGLRRQDVPVQ